MDDKRYVELTMRDPGVRFDWTRRLLRRYPYLETETGKEAMLRVFMEIANAINLERVQKEYHITGDEDNVSPEDRRVVTAINRFVCRNVVSVSVRPTFKTVLSYPMPDQRPPALERYVREWCYHLRWSYRVAPCLCKVESMRTIGHPDLVAKHDSSCLARVAARRKERNPMHLAVNAFCSGGSVAGVFESIANIKQNTMKPKPRHSIQLLARDLLVCLADTLAKARPFNKLEPPEFCEETFRQHSFDPRKSAGYFNTYPHEYENYAGEIVRLANSANQGEAYGFSLASVCSIARRVKQSIHTGKIYDRNWFPTLAAKIAIKAEVRDPDSSTTKTRVFFIMCMIKLMIDKEIFTAPFKLFYNTEFVAIGHIWMNGGAQRIAEYMNADDPEWAWFTSDIRKLDQSLHPGLLTIVFMSMLTFFRKDGEFRERYNVLRAFMVWSADDIVATLIKWTGCSFRIIVGVMFSGLFGTSIGDTLYVVICLKMAVRELVRTWKLQRGIPQPKIKVYGDNIFIGWRKDLLRKLVVSDEYSDTPAEKIPFKGLVEGFLGKFLKETWGLPLKADETSYYEKFYTLVKTTHHLENDTWRTEIVRKGPAFLKRHFIQREVAGVVFAMPFRPVEDYYVKSITTNHSDMSAAIWVSRWAGLILDSAGTNPEAFEYLHFLVRRFVRDYLRADEFYDISSMFSYYINQMPDFWVSRVKKMGQAPPEITRTLTDRYSLMDLFSPDWAPKGF